MATIGETVRRLRIKAGITQKVLADKLGYTREGVAYIETGYRTPRVVTLAKIAKLFDVSLGEFDKCFE